MDLIERVETDLPESDGWKWFEGEGARYRVKPIKKNLCYGLRVLVNGQKQYEGIPVIIIYHEENKIVLNNRAKFIFPLTGEAFQKLDEIKKDFVSYHVIRA